MELLCLKTPGEAKISVEQENLAAMQRSLSNGSKFIIAATVSVLSALLIDVLLRLDKSPEQVTVPGIEITMPAPFAALVLVIVSSAFGWVGLAFLRQTQNLMYHLEFELRVNPDEIKAALAGSSLASANMLLFKTLCVISLFASLKITTDLVLAWIILFNEVGIKPSMFTLTSIDIVLELPFILILLGQRVRYLQPSNWEEGSWLFSLLFKSLGAKVSISARSRNFETLPSGVSRQDAIALIDEIVNYVGQAGAASLHTLLRKHGLGILMHWGEVEAMLGEEGTRILRLKTHDILRQKFPDFSTEKLEKLKNYFMNEIEL